jgi:hypothetical protein
MAYQGNRTGPAANAAGPKARGPPPALNPETPALTQPYKDFISKGFLDLQVNFTPMGVSIGARLRSDLRKEGEQKDDLVPIGEAKARIIEKGLWTPGKPKGTESGKEKGEGNVAPKKTLRKEDLGLNDLQLYARAQAVANNLGDSTARGRIGSLKLMIEECDTFEKWWQCSSAADKTRLITDKKHFESLTKPEIIRLGEILKDKQLFRGPVPTPPTEEEEETAPTRASPPSQALVPKKKGGQQK